MTAIRLSKTRYCRGLQCPKILWMDYNMPDEAEDTGTEAVFKTGNEVGELARHYFGAFDQVPYSEDKTQMIAETTRLLASGAPVIAEASFNYDDNFCSADLLRKNGNAYELIEVKSSTHMTPVYLDDIAYQYYVLTHSGVPLTKAFLMHINNQYVRQGELDLQGLFALEECTEEIKAKQNEIPANITAIKAAAQSETEPEVEPGNQCSKPYDCAYADWCWRNTQAAVKDIPETVNKEAIAEFLSTLPYPLYYLDFETIMPAIPPYDGCWPYRQIPFQYSLHIQKKPGGKTAHKQFLAKAGQDPRRAIAESLCRDIPADVRVLAWNMSFEKARIAELAGDFPDLAAHLLAINENTRDLIVPFRSRPRAYYQKEFNGSASLKAVLPALFPNDPELDYGVLDGIHHGGDASAAYAELPGKSPREAAKIRKALLAYCRLDTLAMVKILEKLRTVAAG